MTEKALEGNQLLYRLVALEVLVQFIAASLLALKFWNVLPIGYVKAFMLLLGGVCVLRLLFVSYLSVFKSSRSNEDERSASRLLMAGNALAGIAWGTLPVLADVFSLLGEELRSFLTISIVAVTLTALAGSALRTPLFMAFAMPAIGIPLAFSVNAATIEYISIWSFMLLVAALLSHAMSGLEGMSTRYRQLIRGNADLLKKLSETRDQAVRSHREVEKANTAIKEEVKERKRAEEKIRASEHELSSILQNMQDTFFRLDQDGKLIRVSASLQFLLGYSHDEVIDKSVIELFWDEAEHSSFVKALESRLGIVENYEARLRHKMGHIVWASVSAHYYKDASGNTAGIEGTVRDVTERKIAAEALFQEKERLYVTLESLGDGVITTDVNGLVEYINPIGEKMMGCTAKEGRGRPLTSVLRLLDEDSKQPVELPLTQWLVAGKRAALANPAILENSTKQSESAIELTGAPIRDSEKAVVGSVLVFRDVTRLRSLAKQLSYQATHDALTGLINRIEFDNRVNQAIKSASQGEKFHALCYLDLDQFKVVNDTCGHHAGDELLKQLTTLLLGTLRESDTLARLGGDEFGVLFHGCPLEKAAEIAEEQRRLVEEYRFVSDGQAFRVGLSIGVVPITQDTVGLTELLSAADSACYVAKERGRNYVHVYQPDDEAVAEQHGQMQWMQRIQHALDNDLFELHFQSIVPVKTEKEKSRRGELLLRMVDDHSRSGSNLILPNAFMPAAERYHLMPQIDRWVVRNSLYALASKNGSEFNLSTCSINLSGQSLSDLKLLDYILDLLKDTGVSPSMLCFEITESAVIANLDIAKQFITQLKEMGCRFALDDFGSGLSSFGYLKNLPVDYVKLDGSLVRDIVGNRVNQAMVHAINYVTHIMGMESIAEYVESEAILKSLKAISVDYAQGYAIDKPYLFSKAFETQVKVSNAG